MISEDGVGLYDSVQCDEYSKQRAQMFIHRLQVDILYMHHLPRPRPDNIMTIFKNKCLASFNNLKLQHL